MGFSPCPNDTFIFDALVNGRIDTGVFSFNTVLEDVEALNLRALRGELDVTKISFGAYSRCMHHYQLLDSGSALGFGVGPLLVKRPDVRTIGSVAIPGSHTTAGYLFSNFFPEVSDRRVMLFSDIEDAVQTGRVDAGVIIHENRFTYESKGLQLVADLGSLWEQSTGKPIPLGGIVIRRSLDISIKSSINRLIRKSLEHAWLHPTDSSEYVSFHAQAMDPDVRRRHIELYVNEYSLDLGEKG
ncbi:MAG: 1,4-dihydroxy-6-naphthoate synthase, partial [Bacteroidota bacterium]